MTKPLRIWLVQSGEEMPDDPGPPRLLRTALLARELSKRGHQVTFWNATFNHQQKTQRFPVTTTKTTSHGYVVHYLFGRAYRKNISLSRILSHIENAREFRHLAHKQPRPDVILTGLPTLELCKAVADFATPREVPFAIDCRDMWPDIFEDYLTGIKGLASAPIMTWWRKLKRKSLAAATAVTGVTGAFVQWGLDAADRQATSMDRPFHLAVPPTHPTTSELQNANSEWERILGPVDPDVTLACYPGTFSTRLDIPSFLEGLSLLDADTSKRFRMVICGKGDLEPLVKEKSANMDHVVFAGWRGAADLRALMERSTFGVLPYSRTPDFRSHYVNKVGEYLSMGLPIMTGLDGLTGDLLERTELGITYNTGDPGSVASAIKWAVNNKKSLEAKKEAARQVYHRMFNPSVIYNEFCDYLEALARSKGR